jgi:hypothetical protein
MDSADPMRIRFEIEQLLLDYWWEVDLRWGERAHEFFTEDGVFRNSVGRARIGRDSIQEFYSGRHARGPRVVRHVVSNLRVEPPAEDGTVTSRWILQIFASDGAPPLPSEPAILLADVTDVCRRDAQGRWRYASRQIDGLFTGSKPTTT